MSITTSDGCVPVFYVYLLSKQSRYKSLLSDEDTGGLRTLKNNTMASFVRVTVNTFRIGIEIDLNPKTEAPMTTSNRDVDIFDVENKNKDT